MERMTMTDGQEHMAKHGGRFLSLQNKGDHAVVWVLDDVMFMRESYYNPATKRGEDYTDDHRRQGLSPNYQYRIAVFTISYNGDDVMKAQWYEGSPKWIRKFLSKREELGDVTKSGGKSTLIKSGLIQHTLHATVTSKEPKDMDVVKERQISDDERDTYRKALEAFVAEEEKAEAEAAAKQELPADLAADLINTLKKDMDKARRLLNGRRPSDIKDEKTARLLIAQMNESSDSGDKQPSADDDIWGTPANA